MPHPLGHAPSKVIAVHLNYASRAKERGRFPSHPSYFLIPPSSLAGTGDPVIRPRGCELLGFEGEVALVMGQRAERVTPQAGWSHVRWVTAANDAGVYDLRYADRGSNLRSKGADGFTPIGPRLLNAADLDPAALRLRTWVNGELAQEDSTDTLLFPFGELIADLSRLVTLEPGDVILTGTPAGASVVSPGDTVEVEVSYGAHSSGRLRNPVAAADHDLAAWGAPPRVDAAARAAAFGGAEPRAGTAGTGTDGAVTDGAVTDGAGTDGAGTDGAGTDGAGTDGAGTDGAVTDGAGTDGAGTGDSAAPLLDPVLAAGLRGVAVATLSAQLLKRGLAQTVIDGVRPVSPGCRMVGVAHTLRYLPLREDLFQRYGGGMNAQKRAIEELRPGHVLVMDARRDPTAGTIGDILAARAARRGAAGIVTDGGLRDSEAVAALGLPVYYAATHPSVLGRRHVPWDSGIPVACGGALVQPGDILAGDADGVVVIPPDLAPELIAAATEQESQERFIAEQVAAGHPVDGLYPLGPAWQATYERWLLGHPARPREDARGDGSRPEHSQGGTA